MAVFLLRLADAGGLTPQLRWVSLLADLASSGGVVSPHVATCRHLPRFSALGGVREGGQHRRGARLLFSRILEFSGAALNKMKTKSLSGSNVYNLADFEREQAPRGDD